MASTLVPVPIPPFNPVAEGIVLLPEVLKYGVPVQGPTRVLLQSTYLLEKETEHDETANEHHRMLPAQLPYPTPETCYEYCRVNLPSTTNFFFFNVYTEFDQRWCSCVPDYQSSRPLPGGEAVVYASCVQSIAIKASIQRNNQGTATVKQGTKIKVMVNLSDLQSKTNVYNTGQ